MILSTLENGKIVKTQCGEVVFDRECDVLCVGAGSAGVYAADSAAREGARVILCEIGSNIGGMHVCGNVTGYYFGARGGAHEEEYEKYCGDPVFFAPGGQWEQRQIHLTERLQKSGVTLLCRYSATGIYWQENRAVGLRMFDGVRQVNIKAAITVDATSDGHLVRMTEVKKHYGRPSDGAYVPFTVRTQYTKNGRFYSCNDDHGHMDHYDAADFSKSTVIAHANTAGLLKKGEIVNLALQMGIREGMTYEGEESVRYGDVLLGKTPERVLFFAYADLDRHGTERATEEELFQNYWVISNLATVAISIPVPLGSVVPKGVLGLVTAGRCLSCDTYLQSAVRMNRDMFRMGECVGVAAALAVRCGGDLLSIDDGEYLSRVEARGCFRGYADSRRFGFDNSYREYTNKMKSLGRDPDPKYAGLSMRDRIYEPIVFDVEQNFHLLASDAPGVAIWSCYLSPDRAAIRRRLLNEMEEAEDPLYRYNCAIALGLLGDPSALFVLREIVMRRDCFFFTDNRRSNQFRSAVAICLLGRLGDASDLPELWEILSERELERPMYHTLEANYLYHAVPDRNFVYFAMLTHAAMAIFKIYRRCRLDLLELHGEFERLFKGDTLLRRVTAAAEKTPAYEETRAFISYMLKITQ